MPRLIAVAAVLVLVGAGPTRAQDMDLSAVLIPDQGWQLVAEGFKFTEGPAPDADGRVYFTDIPNNRIHRIELDGSVSVFLEDSHGTNGLMFGPDGRLYGCQNGLKRITAWDAAGKPETIAEEVASNDLVVAGDGRIYFTDPPGGRVWLITTQREKVVVAEGLRPNGLILWPDQGTLVVTERMEPLLWTFRVESDGRLSHKDAYYGPLQIPPDQETPGSDGMTIDEAGRLYVATRAGVQMFDPTGRLGGTISRPQRGPLANVCFGGREMRTLYVAAGDKVFKREVRPRGVRYAAAK